MLKRIDPRVKFLLMGLLSTAGVCFQTPGVLFALAGICLVISGAGGVAPARILRQLKYALGFILPLFCMHCLFNRQGQGLLYAGSFPLVTWGGVNAGLCLAGRMLTLLLAALILLTSPPRDYLLALIQWRMPYALAFMVMAGLRFVPLLRREAQNLYAAAQMRGAKVKGAGLVLRVRLYASLLLPITAGALRRAEILSIAMEARGFGAEKERTHWRTLRFSPLDWGCLGLMAAGSLAFSLLLC